MYQVLIVDDEYLARNKLEYIIQWESLGFYVAGSVAGGREAIEFIKNTHIDVVFTDICMPDVDGVELTVFIKEHFPHIKVIIMSSYSDFNYVRKCFMADAYDYLLKHTITAQSLCALLERFKSDCLPNGGSNNTSSYDGYVKAQQYKENIIDMIYGNGSVQQETPPSLIAAAKINNYTLFTQTHTNDELNVFYQNITNTMAQILKNLTGFIIFRSKQDYFIIFMPFPDISEAEIMRELKNYIQQINYSIKKFFDLKLLWGFSCMSSPEYSLADCYNEAVHMLEFSPIKDKKEQKNEFEITSISIKNEKNLLNAIQTMNYNNINNVLIDIFSEMPLNQLAVNITAGELITVANKICNEFNINIDSISSNLSQLNPITSYTKEEVFNWSKKLFHGIVDIYTAQSKKPHRNRYSHLVQDYISKHYSEDIGLKQIASSIGITDSHLSTVFREETGETISGYLTKYRVEKAKELLEQNFDIKYLYSTVGFKNYNYFFVAFKKITGCTPIQYKRHHAHN